MRHVPNLGGESAAIICSPLYATARRIKAFKESHKSGQLPAVHALGQRWD